eukprot:1961841-Alexandrium_andersonii.AAC.1
MQPRRLPSLPLSPRPPASLVGGDSAGSEQPSEAEPQPGTAGDGEPHAFFQDQGTVYLASLGP